MSEFYNSALEPLGEALIAYWRGNKSAELVHEFKTGQKKSLPVSVFFRSKEEFFITDNALEYCNGQILIVGAGTGVHALELERQGRDITAIDICPQAIQIMKERGIKNAKQQDFFQFYGKCFDTILMLGQNIGMCQTIKGIKGLLHRCEKLLKPGGQLLVNSMKEPGSENISNQRSYPGELEFRLSFEGNVGSWMHWLHIDFETLSSESLKHGWSTEKLIEDSEGGFLAKLSLL